MDETPPPAIPNIPEEGEVPTETNVKPPSSPRAASRTATFSHRIFNPPKLERKHSSGDLHSRLKTRKILGVGETDNGEIHRSKISQVLGHNEHLYVKFPKGYWAWHLMLAGTCTALGFMNFLLPEQWCSLTAVTSTQKLNCASMSSLANRYYGSLLLGFSVFLWNFWGSNDRVVAKVIATSVATCEGFQLFAILIQFWEDTGFTLYALILIVIRALVILGTVCYYRGIGSSLCKYQNVKRTNSFKDISKSASPDPNSATSFFGSSTNSSPSNSPPPPPSPAKKTE